MNLTVLNETICSCRICPRLVKYRESVIPKKAFSQTYWKKPVPGFGAAHPDLLIIGLAPSAHGGNRTGRIFTGDLSGDFLFKALYQEGLASQPTSVDVNDNLKLNKVYITAAVKCVPPKNLPTAQEKKACASYLHNEFTLLNPKVVLVLGFLAHGAYLKFLKSKGCNVRNKPFVHGMCYEFNHFPCLYCAYHPSPQNTHTGKLTLTQFCCVLKDVKQKIAKIKRS